MNIRTNHMRFQDRRAERGAALITTVLISMLLLAAGSAVVLTASMSSGLASDAASEEQAYIAAEAGLQRTLSVLRGHSAPSPLPTPNPTGQIADQNKISFRTAVYLRDPSGTVTIPSSNQPTDTSNVARLSRWLTYDWTPTGGTLPTRVTLSSPYVPLTGTAFNVEVSDPDNSHIVTYTTSGRFVSNNLASITVADPSGKLATITYTPPSETTVNPAYPSVSTALGSFGITLESGFISATIDAGSPLSFVLTINQTAPWTGTANFSGKIAGTISNGQAPTVTWDYASVLVADTRFAATSTLALTAPGAGGSKAFSANLTAPNPRRILVRSTGFGPRGAQKKLEMMVNRSGYDLNPPAPIVIRGADPVTTWPPPESVILVGSSNAKWYSGQDISNNGDNKPTIAISLHDWSVVSAMSKPETVDTPRYAILDIDASRMSPWPASEVDSSGNPPATTIPSAVTPEFLKTADNARAFLDAMAARAHAQGRYMTSLNGMAGDDNPLQPEFTFVDGDCVLDGGAGLLIVTGRLTLMGNRDFKGIIMVLGTGEAERDGSGNGKVEGAWYVAKFNRTFPLGTESRNFLAPSFDVNGGGTGDFVWNYKMGQMAQNHLAAVVGGIAEF